MTIESELKTCAVLALLATLVPFAQAADPHPMSWTVDGIEREAIVYAPAKTPKSGSPLLFVFHGHGGNMRAAANGMKYQSVWPEAIVVYPQGLPTVTPRDPEGKRSGWQHLPRDNKDRDLKFVDTMLGSLHEKYKIDDIHVYATGFSNGGAFTYLLWDQRPKEFAALAPCGGPLRKELKLSEPKPAFIVAGKEDKLVPIKAQEAAIEIVRKLNSATVDGKIGDGDSMVYRSEKGTPVHTLVHSGGHILPADAPRLIADFFREQELLKK